MTPKETIQQSVTAELESESVKYHSIVGVTLLCPDAVWPYSMWSEEWHGKWLVQIYKGDGMDPEIIALTVCDRTHEMVWCHNI